jgi:hypothetical protein
MEKLRCKCVKGLDGFTWGEIYDVEFAGRVWWAVNDDGKRVSGASESFDPIEEPISDDLEKACWKAREKYDAKIPFSKYMFKAGAKWQKEKKNDVKGY